MIQRRWLSWGAALAALVALAGCASKTTAVRYHSLMPAPERTTTPAAAPPVAWQLTPVRVPAQVDRAQWVVRTVDGSLAVLEQEQWIAALPDELYSALAERLARRLGPPALGATPRWRVELDVQRFDLVPGRFARLDAVWTVVAEGAPSALRCAATFEHDTAGGYGALADGQARAVTALGDQIASALAAFNAGPAPACPAAR